MTKEAVEEKIKKEEEGVRFIPSGSTLLDLTLGGGWAESRIINIVGDRSSGKTGLSIEAFANFHRKYPTGRMRYAEAEAAFDNIFARQLGFPKVVEKPEELLHTVEEFKEDLFKFAQEGGPSLYVLDSLDALSTSDEVQNFRDKMEGKKEKGSFGTEKAKEMSQLFRLVTQEIGKENCTMIIISQIRDNVGVTFGEQKTRSGGKALDFYASQVIWLAELSKVLKSYKAQEEVIGVNIRSRCKKNKVGFPHKEAEYPILFGYGIDNHISCIDYLVDYKEMEQETAKDQKKKISKARENQDRLILNEIEKELIEDVTRIWKERQDATKIKMSKYEEVV